MLNVAKTGRIVCICLQARHVEKATFPELYNKGWWFIRSKHQKVCLLIFISVGRFHLWSKILMISILLFKVSCKAMAWNHISIASTLKSLREINWDEDEFLAAKCRWRKYHLAKSIIVISIINLFVVGLQLPWKIAVNFGLKRSSGIRIVDYFVVVHRRRKDHMTRKLLGFWIFTALKYSRYEFQLKIYW